MNYDDKVVAFIDILGFSRMIEDTLPGDVKNQEKAILRVKKIFDTVNFF